MIIRAVNRLGNGIGRSTMLWVVALILPMTCSGCNNMNSEVHMDDADPSEVANEAVIVLSENEVRVLKEKAQAGDLGSAKKLANFFIINLGMDQKESLKWQLQAARLGDCEYWADLMFLENNEKFVIPRDLFLSGEDLASIGEKNKCMNYKAL